MKRSLLLAGLALGSCCADPAFASAPPVEPVCQEDEPCWDADTMGDLTFGPRWDCSTMGDLVCSPWCRLEVDGLTHCDLRIDGPATASVVAQPIFGQPTIVPFVAVGEPPVPQQPVATSSVPRLPATGAAVQVWALAVAGGFFTLLGLSMLLVGLGCRRAR